MSQVISTLPPEADGHFVMIPLTRGKFAIVDEADAELVMSMGRWMAVKSARSPDVFYAERRQYPSRQTGSSWKRIFMHNLIMGFKGVDHANLNGLDNRRVNLRPATRSQNGANRKAYQRNSTGYKGVYRISGDKWRAAICADGRRMHLGVFADPVEAACAYNRAALEMFGEYARLNPVPEVAAPSAGRISCPVKLSAGTVLECRVRAAAGEANHALATEFGVAESSMSRAVRGETWRHVPFPDAAEPPAA